MNNIIERIDFLRADLDALLPMAKEAETRLWEKFQLEWNYNSNHIEGNTLSFNETKTLFRLGDEFRAQNNSLKDVQEMRAHDVAIEMVKQWVKDKERLIAESEIRALNETILVKPFWADALTPDGQNTRRQIIPGEYKKHPNHVQLKSGKIFKYAEPNEVPQKMQELLLWYSTTKEHPLIVATFLHYKFVCIHPFDDGNGRVSRLLMNYHLLRNGYPPVIIKSKDKNNYLYALQQADAGDKDAFVKYIGEQLIWSLDLQLKAAKGESIEEEGDLYKEIEVWKKHVLVGEKLKRTEAIVKEVIDTTFVGLFEKANPVIEKFKDLFNKFEKIATYYLPENLRSNLPVLNNAEIENKDIEKDTWHIYMLYFFKNPKLIGANKFRTIFRFNLFEDKYDLAYITVIDDEDNHDFKTFAEKSYNERFTGIEIDNFINLVMKEAFEKMKEAYN